MTGRLNLVFMGSPDFSVAALQALIAAGHQIVCVYAQPPRPAGRGHKETPCPVHAFALEHGLQVRTPESLKDVAEQQAFIDLKADACVVAAYGLILPKPILDAPRLGCLNIHASLLPRWRGAAPIQRAIIAGDDQSGVTIMAMDEGLDTGAILLAQKTPITSQTTAADLHDRLADLGAKLIVQALEKNNLTATPQSQQGVTYATKLDRAEGRLDWSLPAAELERRVRGLNPWPGVWFEHGGTRIKVLAAAVSGQSGAVGEVLDGLPSIACAEDALTLLRVQKQGRGAMAGGDFLRGFDLPVGTILT
ncbi:MAG: methionyl-tRNA formyltransferase [Rhodospirillaceae bacterium]|nr:methionyl-tRNA formyltransferase [Rhodospirillaceae bacterium]MBL6941463.1 methionyl-tRNA formyltransferase [Rhodospirillales bacterium]